MAVYGGCSEKELDRNILEAVLSETVAGVALVSPRSDGIKLEYTNNAFFSIFGYTREEYEFLDDKVRMSLFNKDDFIKVISHLNSNYTAGKTVQFECRVNKKGGEENRALFTATMLDPDIYGQNKFVCNIVDITDLKKLQLEIQSERERYELVEEISDDIVFTYDVIKDTFDCSPKILNSLRRQTHIDNAIEHVTYGDVFDHRDVSSFIEAISNAFSGRRVNSFDARIINLHGDGIWYRMKFAAIYDDDGNALKFVGTMRNIDSEKKEKNRLISQAEKDNLSGFLNKISTGMKINEIVRDSSVQKGMFILIDIDNFKQISEISIQKSDAFLKKFSENILLRFRSGDVLGRIGTDKFVIFVSGLTKDSETTVKKINDIADVCKTTSLAENLSTPVTCSIGVSFYPDCGTTYGELLEKANEALSKVKATGKNNFAFVD